jgi:hypothetical protein
MRGYARPTLPTGRGERGGGAWLGVAFGKYKSPYFPTKATVVSSRCHQNENALPPFTRALLIEKLLASESHTAGNTFIRIHKHSYFAEAHMLKVVGKEGLGGGCGLLEVGAGGAAPRPPLCEALPSRASKAAIFCTAT